MKKRNIQLFAGVVVIVAAFVFFGGSWSSAFAGEMSVSGCVGVYAGGPDFIFNARPENIVAANGGNCLTKLSVDQGPTWLANPHMTSSEASQILAECPPVQTGAPTFLVNAEPITNPSFAGIEGKCSPG